ncbi:MAG: hypothetical protein [Circular genetic element sp.]|nr:MAG: hypothetical protein [Circular genetic element sp.]
MNTFHIIVRPRIENFDKNWFEMLKDNFSDFLRYTITIALERGHDKTDCTGQPIGCYNHIDMTVTCTSRQDNIRAKVIKCLNYVPEDDEEAARWLKVVAHDCEKYCHGYTLKEHETPFWEEGDPWYSNHPKIDECGKVYNEGKPKHKSKTNSLNKLLGVALEYYDNHREEFNEASPTLRAICVKLVVEDRIPFSLGRKIRRQDNIFFKHMVENLSIHEIDMYISSLED